MILKIFNSPSLTTILNLSVKGLALILINPFIFKIFTNEEIVIWYLVISAVSIQLIFDFGLLPNSTRILSRIKGEHDSKSISFKEIDDFKNQTFSIYVVFSLVVLIFSLISVKLYLLDRTKEYMSHYLLYLIMFSGCVGIFNNYYGTLIQSTRRVEILQRNLALSNFISVLISTFVLFLFQNLGLTLICFFSNHLINLFLLPNLLVKEDRIRKFSLNFNFINNELINSSIRSGIGVIFSLGFFHIINFYVSDKFDSLVAAQYLLFMQIIRAISSFSQAPFYAFIPTFNYLYGSNQLDMLTIELNKRLNHSLTFYLFLVIISDIIFPFIFQIINSGSSFEFNNLWKNLTIAFFFERISASVVQIITITKKIIWHWYNLIMALFMICIYFFFLSKENIESIPIAIGTAYIFLGIPLVIYILKQSINLPFSNSLKFQFLIGIILSVLFYV